MKVPIIPINAQWNQYGIIVAGGNEPDSESNRLRLPRGMDVDNEETIYITHSADDRITKWEKGVKNSQVVAGGNGQGNRNDQLNGPINVIIDYKTDSLIIADLRNRRVVRWPRRNGTNGETLISDVLCWGLAIDMDNNLYVSDYEKHEVRRWKIGEKSGTLVAGGNDRGRRLDQLNDPYYIFVDEEQSVYVSDNGNHRIMKWLKGAQEGVVVAGGQEQGSSLTQLNYPEGIIVNQFGTIYIVDSWNNRVMRWLKDAKVGEVVLGGNGRGNQPNQFSGPAGISYDRQNNLYVVEHLNRRVQKFLIN